MNATIIRLSVQALAGRRRFWLLLSIPLLLLGLAILVRSLAGEGVAYDAIVSELGIGTGLPIVALLAATAVLGPEIDDGSVVYLLSKPVSRRVVALSKYVVALAATLLCGVLPLLPIGLLLDSDSLSTTLAWMAGGALAATAYTAGFLALASLTRHGIVVGILYVFIWEGLLSRLFAGIRWVSVSAWARGLAADLDSSILLATSVGLTYALIAAAVLTVAGVWLTGERLRSFTLRGED